MRKNKSSYFYILPLALIMFGLIYIPVIITLVYSVVNLNLLKPAALTFVGLKNYIRLLKDPDIWTAAVNSTTITVIVLILTVLLGLAFALMLFKNTRIKGILTGLVIIPWAMPGIVNGIIWRWMFHPSFGLINSILQKLNMIHVPVQWFSGRWNVLMVVSLSVAWKCIPLAAVIFLAALQSIPEELYESAAIDGSGAFDKLRYITLPMLRPSFVIVLTTTAITAINVVDEIVSLVGMASANNTLMTEIYLRTFKYMRFSEGSALSWLVMIVCTVIGVIYIRNVNKKAGVYDE